MSTDTDPIQNILSQSQGVRLWLKSTEEAVAHGRQVIAEQTVLSVPQLNENGPQIDKDLLAARSAMLDGMQEIEDHIRRVRGDIHAKVAACSATIGVQEIFPGYED